MWSYAFGIFEEVVISFAAFSFIFSMKTFWLINSTVFTFPAVGIRCSFRDYLIDKQCLWLYHRDYQCNNLSRTSWYCQSWHFHSPKLVRPTTSRGWNVFCFLKDAKRRVMMLSSIDYFTEEYTWLANMISHVYRRTSEKIHISLAQRHLYDCMCTCNKEVAVQSNLSKSLPLSEHLRLNQI